MDYHVFRKGFYQKVPPFIIGRGGYDNWLIHHALTQGIPVVDTSEVVTCVHQNHDYSHIGKDMRGFKKSGGAQVNKKLAGGRGQLMNVKDATHILTKNGIVKTPLKSRVKRNIELDVLTPASQVKKKISNNLKKIGIICILF
jgi:hypothetical protein